MRVYLTAAAVSFAIFLSNNAYAQGTWDSSKASMPQARYATASGVINGILYVAGGTLASGTANNVLIYDPNTDGWSTGATMSTARAGMAVGVINNKLYITEGWVNSDSNTSSATPRSDCRRCREILAFVADHQRTGRQARGHARKIVGRGVGVRDIGVVPACAIRRRGGHREGESGWRSVHRHLGRSHNARDGCNVRGAVHVMPGSRR